MPWDSPDFWNYLFAQSPVVVVMTAGIWLGWREFQDLKKRHDRIIDFLLEKAFDEEETRELRNLP